MGSSLFKAKAAFVSMAVVAVFTLSGCGSSGSSGSPGERGAGGMDGGSGAMTATGGTSASGGAMNGNGGAVTSNGGAMTGNGGAMDGGSTPDGAAGSTSNPTDAAPGPKAHLRMDRQPSYDFGSVLINTRSQLVNFTVSNDGDADSGRLGAATLSGSDPGVFTLTDACAKQPLAPGASCTVGVVMAPTAVGTPSAVLSVSGTPGGTVSVNLSGTAVTPGAIAVTPSPEDFGSVTAGTGSSTRTLTLTNGGGASTGPVGLAATGTDQDSFTVIAGGTCVAGQTLSPGKSCTAVVRFAPSTSGSKAASLTASADPGGPGVASLTGVALTPAALGFDKGTYSAETVSVGATNTVTLTLQNSGMSDSGPLPVLATTGDAAFSVTAGGTCHTGVAVPAGMSCTIVVKLAPSSFGAKNGSISVTASPGGTATASLTGTGKQTFTLTVTKAGAGTGTLTVDGTVCAAFPCVRSYDVTLAPPTAVVTETPTAVTSAFGGWTTDCTGTGACSLTMNANHTVQGSFVPHKYTVTVNLSSVRGAGGSVSASSSPSGPAMNCSATACTANFDYGTTVTLGRALTAGSLFQSWGPPCANRFAATCGTGALTANFTTTATFRPPINYMFVTSDTVVPTSFAGDITVADKHCDAVARAAGLVDTPTTGTAYFKALLASTGGNAASRLTGAQGWLRPDGREFANLPSDIFKNSGSNALQIFYPPSITETSSPVDGGLSITGSDFDGTPASTCTDYTSNTGGITLGAPRGGAGVWMFRQNNTGCSSWFHLYCFETAQPPTAVAPTAPVGSRRAFVTAGSIAGTAGRDAADTLCATEANGHLTGTFAALLPLAGHPASERFTGSAPWARPDGTLIAATVAELLNWNVLSPIDQDASGNYVYSGGPSVWVGASAPNQAPFSLDYDCNDWGAMPGTASGSYFLEAGSLWDGYAWSTRAACTESHRVFCLQQ